MAEPPPVEPPPETAADLLEELTLLSLYLSSWPEPAAGDTVRRAWRGHRFDVLDALEAHGLIGGRRAKSVHLTDEGVRRAKEIEARIGSSLA